MDSHAVKYNNIEPEIIQLLQNDLTGKDAAKEYEDDSSLRIHLAIFVEPFLSFILDGTKTVESRFSKNRISPYKNVKKGDILLIKKSGGPIYALARVGHVWFYNVEPGSMVEIRRLFGKGIVAESDDFWDSKSESKYVTLMQLEKVWTIKPLHVQKSDRRGWVTVVRTIK